MIFRKKILHLRSVCIAILVASLFNSCNKQEKIWQFNIQEQEPPPPPATSKDTMISVMALLNNDTFKALGRAEPPGGNFNIVFSDLNSEAYLKLVLGADTPGTYIMNRDVSEHTALWYNAEGNSFTSRATPEAGGTVTILEVDTVKHRVKGNFDLLLLSRTDNAQYKFQDGTFDILYNHFTLMLDDKILNIRPDETVKTVALTNGSASDPKPAVYLKLNDSLTFNLAILKYNGTGSYAVEDKDKVSLELINTKSEKIFSAHSGSISLIRFNYGQFIQLLFEGELQADNGEKIHISMGSVVIGK